MCIWNRVIKNPKYKINKKNGGIIPAVNDIRAMYVPIGCGKCIECAKQKAREWQVRLLEDIKHNKNGIFITLTFSNENITKIYTDEKINHLSGYELDNAAATLATRLFLERWRKKYKKSLRHWLVTELGHNGTENIHMHGIIWTNESVETIKNIWQYGYIWPRDEEIKTNYVNESTVNYITKYISKQDFKHKEYKPKILTSAGIGRGYITEITKKINKYKPNETKEVYTTTTGHRIAMPTYWRNKIYTEEEREKLWIEKLDKQERWILGVKVDISNGEEKYYKLLKEARIKNKRLGYGDNKKNWSREEYEKQRRVLKQKERITTKEEPTKQEAPNAYTAIKPNFNY